MRKRIAAIVSFACGIMPGIGLLTCGGTYTKAEDVSLAGGVLEQKYVVGTKLSVPEGKLVYDGKTYDAEAVWHFPSGNAYKSDEIELNEAGRYTLEYRAVINGKLVSETVAFEGWSTLWSVTSERSSVTFGTAEKYPDAPEGIAVSLARGDEFRLEKTIDLNELDKTGSDVLQMYLTPLADLTADAFSMYITFTDAYNPENYVSVSVNSQNSTAFDSWPTYCSFVTACVPYANQNYTGCFYDYVNGNRTSTIYKNMRTSGFCSDLSFYGNNVKREYNGSGSYDFVKSGKVGDNFLTLRWDYEKRQLHGDKPIEELGSLITDFDDPSFYANPWGGFTTGECYVSIRATDYNQPSFNFVVNKIGDWELQADKTAFKDNGAPEITVDYGNYTAATLPSAKVGCSYPVPKASAFDATDGNLPVSARAYYEDKIYEVSCTDAFVPDQPGDFTIEYTATDRAGNTAIKQIIVKAEQTAPSVYLSVAPNALKTGKKGSRIEIAEAFYEGGVGALSLTVSATEKESQLVYDCSGGSFRPMAAGVYKVEYVLKDDIGQTLTYVYEITVDDTAAPVFLEAPVLTKYFIVGYDYQLPQAQAYDFSNNTYVEAEIYADTSGGEQLLNNGIYFADAEGTVKIVYKASGAAGTGELEFDIPAITVKTGDKFNLTKYFSLSGTETGTVSDNDKISLSLSGASVGRAEFINPVLARNFSAEFTVDPEKNEFTELALYLTDSVNAREKIKLSWKNAGSVNILYVNDKATEVTSAFGFGNNVKTDFCYTDGKFTDNSTATTTEITSTIYNEAFKGFSSGKIYVEFEISGTSGKAALFLSKLGNQPVRTMRDTIAPQYALVGGDYPTQTDSNTILKIKDVISADVLSPNTTATVTMRDQRNVAVSTVAGRKLENAVWADDEVLLVSAGKYTIEYVVSDGTRSATFTVNITVLEKTPPVIVVEEPIVQSARKGDIITLPKASATDAKDGEVNYYVVISMPTGSSKRLSVNEGGTFTAEYAGVYYAYYVAYDGNGNMSLVKYAINVS